MPAAAIVPVTFIVVEPVSVMVTLLAVSGPEMPVLLTFCMVKSPGTTTGPRGETTV